MSSSSSSSHPLPPSQYLQKLLKYQQQQKPIPYLLQKYFEATNDISQPEYIRKYNNIFKDESFIDIWLFYIYLRMNEEADEDPEDTKAFLKYLRFNGIGRRRATLYILWATFEIIHGDLDKARRAIEFGQDEKNQAQPGQFLQEANQILEQASDESGMIEAMRTLMDSCIEYQQKGGSSGSHSSSTNAQGSSSSSSSTTESTKNIPNTNDELSRKREKDASSHSHTHTHTKNTTEPLRQIHANQQHATSSHTTYRGTSKKRKSPDQDLPSSRKQRTATSYGDLLKSPQSSHSTYMHHSHTHKQNYKPTTTTNHQHTDENSPPQSINVYQSADDSVHRVEHHESFFSSVTATNLRTTNHHTSGTVDGAYTQQQQYATTTSGSPSSAGKRSKSISSSRRSLKKARRRNRSGQFDPTSESLLDALSTGKKQRTSSGTSLKQQDTNQSAHQQRSNNTHSQHQSSLKSSQHAPPPSVDTLASMAAASSSLADERPRKRRKVTMAPIPPQRQQSLPSMQSSQQSSSKISVNGKDFTIIEEIGRGGSSRVYKVVGRDRKICALKRVLLTGHDTVTATGFKNEIALLKELQKEKNIIQLIDYEEKMDTQELLLLMECGDIDLGSLLRNRLRQRCSLQQDSNPNSALSSPDGRNTTLSMNSIRVYWEQMLQSVNAIHRHGIVHGDLKPANFLLVKGEIKLIDFGIAQKIQHEFTSNIVRDTQIGTLNYIPPEALKEVEDQGESSKYKLGTLADVWSLGCILYQMVTGSPPFSCYKSAWKKIVAITSEDSKIDFSRVGSDPDLLEVLKCCLQRNPQKRLSISELLQHPFLKPTSQTTFALQTMRNLDDFCHFFGLSQSEETRNRCEAMVMHLKNGGSFWTAIEGKKMEDED